MIHVYETLRMRYGFTRRPPTVAGDSPLYSEQCMRTALGLSLLVLGVSFTVGCGSNEEPQLPPEWEYSPNTVQEETINSSVVQLDSDLVLVAGGRPQVLPNKWGEEEKKKSRISALYDPES